MVVGPGYATALTAQDSHGPDPRAGEALTSPAQPDQERKIGSDRRCKDSRMY